MSIDIIEPNLKFRDELRKRDLSEVDLIVMHHSASPMDRTTIFNIHEWHLQRGWLGCGYHYVIHLDGTIFQGRPVDTVGAHVRSYNDISVGICVVGNFEFEHPTTYQQEATGKLLAYLVNKVLRGNSVAIKRHKDLGATLCPGRNFTFLIPQKNCDKLKREVRGLFERIDKIRKLAREE